MRVYELSLDLLFLLLCDSVPGKEKEQQVFTNEEMLENYMEVLQVLNLLFFSSAYMLQKSLVVR